MCVRMCVCVRERERERERDAWRDNCHMYCIERVNSPEHCHQMMLQTGDCAVLEQRESQAGMNAPCVPLHTPTRY